MNNFKDNVNCIEEIEPGRFRIILDFATTKILPFLIRKDYKYVWVHNHKSGNGVAWEEFNLPITENSSNLKVLAKSLSFDFILTTEEFKKIMENWKGEIHLIQMNNLPPYYLDLENLNGNKRSEMLEKECDYLFEVDIPSATDYGILTSPNKDYLQSLLDNKEIDWRDLP